MARARLLKPGFFTNDKLNTLHPYARLLFAGLWTIADREGRLEDRPLRIKAEIFPYDNVKVPRLLDALEEAAFILRYESGNVHFIQILSFRKHQTPHVREPASIIPAPDEHWDSTVPAPDEHESGPAVAVAVIDPVAVSGVTAAEPPAPSRKRALSVDDVTWINETQAKHPTVNVREIIARKKNRNTWDDYKDHRAAVLVAIGFEEKKVTEATNGRTSKTGRGVPGVRSSDGPDMEQWDAYAAATASRQ